MEFQFIWGGCPSVRKLPLFKRGDLVDAFLPYRWCLVATDESGRVMGVVQFLKVSFRLPGFVGVGAIEVAPEFRGQGVAKALLVRMLRMCRKAGRGLRMTDYTSMGEQCIKPHAATLASRMQVALAEG